VVISITDNGGGIPKKVRDRIFEPFFTTKEVGVGTGQGLAIAHNVITKSHNGQIWFDTEEGRGTTFYIKLPMVQNESK
jgi:signal transduction histidine kinase